MTSQITQIKAEISLLIEGIDKQNPGWKEHSPLLVILNKIYHKNYTNALEAYEAFDSLVVNDLVKGLDNLKRQGLKVPTLKITPPLLQKLRAKIKEITSLLWS